MKNKETSETMHASGPPTIPAKTILSRNKTTQWFGCEFNMNLYRGCCHGCIYCDSRSDCYRIDNFDTVRQKQDALRLLRDELARKIDRGVVATGAMSDPYNPFEKKTLLTRHALELLNAYGFGVAIDTKSDLITRDIDLLQEIQEHSPVLCKITVTTPYDELSAAIEPHAPSSSARLATVKKLADNGLFSGVLLMPVLPWLEDSDQAIGELVDRVAEAGGRFVYPAFGVTMRSGQREYFLSRLDTAFPEQQYGKKYRQHFGNRYYCASPRAKQLDKLFKEKCAKNGLLYRMQDIVNGYRAGKKIGQQLSFFT